MTKTFWLPGFCVTLLFVFGCSGLKFGSRMPYAIDTANQLKKTQPAVAQDIPVDYHGADFIRFVDDQSLLVGSVTFDVAGTPEYGPVILYDTNSWTELWRIPREPHYATRYQFFAYHPYLVMRRIFQGKIRHAAYDRTTGRRKWFHQTDDKSPRTYRFSPALTITDLYVLSAGVLKDIDMLTGGVKWQTTTPSMGGAPSNVKLIARDDTLVVVSGQKIMAYTRRDGRLAWDLPNPMGSESRVIEGPKGMYLYAGKAAVHVNDAGKMDWNWQSRAGAIKLMTPHARGLFVVTRHPEGEKDTLHAVGARGSIWKTILPGNVMSPLLNVQGMIYLTTAPQETESGQRTLVGIGVRSGKMITRLPLASMPVVQETAFVPLPDKLIPRGNNLLVLREHYGISVIDRKKKRTVWKQPLFGDAKGTNINLMSRVDPRFNMTLKDQYNPSYVSSNLESGQTAMHYQLKYQHLQQSTETLARTRPNLGESAGATAASMKMQRDFNTAASALVAMNALADASGAFWTAFGESLIAKSNIAAKMTAITGIRLAEAQYQAALSTQYFIPPPTETITVVDLHTGKRSDLSATLAIPNLPGRAWTVALSPDETKLAAVGIGLNSNRYRPINRGMLEVPGSSLVVYNVRALDFEEQIKVPEPVVAAVPQTKTPPTTGASIVSPDATYMITAGYPPLVAYATHGTLEDVKKALAAGENVNTPYAGLGLTPLMAATGRGNVAMVKLLLEAGADVNARSVFGKTAYFNLSKLKDPAVRAKIKKLLDSAAKNK